MDKETKAVLRQRLMAELNSITKQREENEHFGMEDGLNHSVGELSGYDNHPADLGSEMFERGKDLALNDASHRHLQDVQAALERIESDAYGICEVCKEPIDEARMHAVPWARTCREHHPDQHVLEKRPVEEQVIKPFKRSKDYSYDREDAWQEVERYGTSNPPDFFPDGESYNDLITGDDQAHGYEDLTEGFSVTDLSGEPEDITEITHNDAYQRKEEG